MEVRWRAGLARTHKMFLLTSMLTSRALVYCLQNFNVTHRSLCGFIQRQTSWNSRFCWCKLQSLFIVLISPEFSAKWNFKNFKICKSNFACPPVSGNASTGPQRLKIKKEVWYIAYFYFFLRPHEVASRENHISALCGKIEVYLRFKVIWGFCVLWAL